MRDDANLGFHRESTPFDEKDIEKQNKKSVSKSKQAINKELEAVKRQRIAQKRFFKAE